MPISAEQVAVTDTATPLHAVNEVQWTRIKVQVPTGGTAVFLGASDVTDTDGYSLAAGQREDFIIPPGEELHAVTATGSSTVHVFRA